MSVEQYLHIFSESVWQASVLNIIPIFLHIIPIYGKLIPIYGEWTFFAMKAFGGFDMKPAFVLAVTGATLGQLSNWWLGRLLLKAKNSGQLRVTDQWYNRVAAAFIKYGVFLLFFSWAPICNIFVLVAGFLDTRFKIVLTLVIAGQVFNYGRYLI